ncbi:MAG: hypothetical protein WBA74_25600 [Cyclobacteriaceae bacterium]
MKRFVAISLSLLLLLGSMSFSLVSHYCMGMMMKSDITLTHKKLDCGMEMDTEEDDHPDHRAAIDYDHCCENKYVSFNLSEEFQPVSIDVTVDFTISGVPLPSTEKVFFPFYTYYSCFTDKSPPDPEQNLQVLYQTFLI